MTVLLSAAAKGLTTIGSLLQRVHSKRAAGVTRKAARRLLPTSGCRMGAPKVLIFSLGSRSATWLGCRMRITLCGVFFFGWLTAFPHLARAALGDTVDQLTSKYGQPFDSSGIPPIAVGKNLCFRNKPYLIITAVLNGKVGAEVIVKADQSVISDLEQAAILGTEVGGGGNWNTVKTNVLMKDDGTMAAYDPSTHRLTLMSNDYFAAVEAAKAGSPAQ